MDLKLTDGSNKFKCRVNAVIINEGKILTVEINHNESQCCPGGHVSLGESSAVAMERELLEETGLKVKSQRLLCIIENFFGDEDEKYHELSFYYLVDVESLLDRDKDFSLVEDDHGKMTDLDFRWIEISKLDDDFRPYPLRDKLKAGDFSFEHIIYNDITKEKICM